MLPFATTVQVIPLSWVDVISFGGSGSARSFSTGSCGICIGRELEGNHKTAYVHVCVYLCV